MVSRILALIVWAAVAASVAYWGLRWFSKPMAVPAGTSSVALTSAPRGDIGKLLKAPHAAPDAPVAEAAPTGLAARVQLLGVVAPRTGAQSAGVALLALDGKPARAYKIGHVVDGDQVVQAITQQGVEIGPQGGSATVNLSLPLLPPPATGTLPPAGMGGVPPAGVRPMGTPAAQYAPDMPQAGTEPPAPDATPEENARRMNPRLRRQASPSGLPGQPGSPQPAAPPL